IADIFVVNKADREGADRTAASIEAMLTLENWDEQEWRPPVLRTEATASRGINEVVDMIATFEAHSGARMGARRRARAEWRLREILSRAFMRALEARLQPGDFERTLDRIAAREVDPYQAAAELMSEKRPGVISASPSAPEMTPGVFSGTVFDHVGIGV